MFKKALFKQSCKANWLMWLIITIAVCFMLSCVMLISGKGGTSEIIEGISDTIIVSEIDTSLEKSAINYYQIVDGGLETFDNSLKSSGSKETAISSLNDYLNALITNMNIASDSTQAQELKGIMFYSLNLDFNADGENDYDAFYTSLGETAKSYDTDTLSSSSDKERREYRQNYAKETVAIILAGNTTNTESVNAMVNALASYGVTKESYSKYSYEVTTESGSVNKSRYVGEDGYSFIKKMSIDTINSFSSRLNYDVDVLGKDKQTASAEIMGDLTQSFLSNVPKDVSSALEELGKLDMYGLVVGSVFFKMAGLLLPIIYMIMVANNLIAGQVDSGSMAYILSTSTKRKQVVFTQACFLVGSLFAMFCCTTLTSVICLSLIDAGVTELTYGQIILLNLGAFLAMFAMSGISFLASCWFNRSKHSMSVGGGLNMFFLVATMLGLFASHTLPSVIRLKALNFFNYVSVISLFDAVNIMDGGLTFIWKLAVLLVIGLACYFIAGRKFEKKDLPL